MHRRQASAPSLAWRIRLLVLASVVALDSASYIVESQECPYGKAFASRELSVYGAHSKGLVATNLSSGAQTYAKNLGQELVSAGPAFKRDHVWVSLTSPFVTKELIVGDPGERGVITTGGVNPTIGTVEPEPFPSTFQLFDVVDRGGNTLFAVSPVSGNLYRSEGGTWEACDLPDFGTIGKSLAVTGSTSTVVIVTDNGSLSSCTIVVVQPDNTCGCSVLSAGGPAATAFALGCPEGSGSSLYYISGNTVSKTTVTGGSFAGSTKIADIDGDAPIDIAVSPSDGTWYTITTAGYVVYGTDEGATGSFQMLDENPDFRAIFLAEATRPGLDLGWMIGIGGLLLVAIGSACGYAQMKKQKQEQAEFQREYEAERSTSSGWFSSLFSSSAAPSSRTSSSRTSVSSSGRISGGGATNGTMFKSADVAISDSGKRSFKPMKGGGVFADLNSTKSGQSNYSTGYSTGASEYSSGASAASKAVQSGHGTGKADAGDGFGTMNPEVNKSLGLEPPSHMKGKTKSAGYGSGRSTGSRSSTASGGTRTGKGFYDSSASGYTSKGSRGTGSKGRRSSASSYGSGRSGGTRASRGSGAKHGKRHRSRSSRG